MKCNKIEENPAICMRKILDILDRLKEVYRWYHPTFNKVKRMYEYCLELIQCELVHSYEWFISKVLFETIDDAYEKLKVVLGT